MKSQFFNEQAAAQEMQNAADESVTAIMAIAEFAFGEEPEKKGMALNHLQRQQLQALK